MEELHVAYLIVVELGIFKKYDLRSTSEKKHLKFLGIQLF
jgi:hypothetical protein